MSALRLVGEDETGPTVADLTAKEGAEMLADVHRSIAGRMPLGEGRALMLRCAVRWDRLARIPGPWE